MDRCAVCWMHGVFSVVTYAVWFVFVGSAILEFGSWSLSVFYFSACWALSVLGNPESFIMIQSPVHEISCWQIHRQTDRHRQNIITLNYHAGSNKGYTGLQSFDTF